MALMNRTQVLDTSFEPGSDLEDEGLEKLESDLKQMAQRIAEYRAMLPEQLRNALAAVLLSQRPVLGSIESGSEPGSSVEANPDSEAEADSSTGQSLANGEKESSEKTSQLKERMSKNISALPMVIKRTQDCMDRIDKLDSLNRKMHPAFRKKRRT